MCEYTSTRAAAVQPTSLFGNKTQTYKAPAVSYADTDSVSPLTLGLFLSEPLANRHTRGQLLPHIKRGLFSLYVVMPVNLLTGTANRGNLPSCSCVLRETLESVETANSISLTFSPWLWWHKQPATRGGRKRGGKVRRSPKSCPVRVALVF